MHPSKSHVRVLIGEFCPRPGTGLQLQQVEWGCAPPSIAHSRGPARRRWRQSAAPAPVPSKTQPSLVYCCCCCCWRDIERRMGSRSEVFNWFCRIHVSKRAPPARQSFSRHKATLARPLVVLRRAGALPGLASCCNCAQRQCGPREVRTQAPSSRHRDRREPG